MYVCIFCIFKIIFELFQVECVDTGVEIEVKFSDFIGKEILNN